MPKIAYLMSMIFLLNGCAVHFPELTENYRARMSESELHALILHVSHPVEFRSIRALDSLMDEGKFKKMVQRTLRIDRETPGRIITQGENWVSVNFGQGIVLTFARRQTDSVYATAGWGTITVDAERYDIVVGILSGVDIDLRVRQ
jgi:hypothetical protein